MPRLVAGALDGKIVAVTGAGGFLGGQLMTRLAGTRSRAVHTADLGDQAVWNDVAGEADIVIHLAAQTSTAIAAGNPAADFEANVMPMRRLLDACRRRQRRPFVVFAGTVTEAGLTSRLPVNEDVADHPITVYDQHKLLAENDLKSAVSEGTASGASLRLPNVYGPGGHGRRHDRDVLNRMIRTAMQGQPLTVYGAGDYVRDYLFIDDAVNAFVMAAANPEPLDGRHFVVGSGQATTIRQAFELVAARVEARLGRKVPVTTAPAPAGLTAIERRNFVADHSRLTAATGWRPAFSLADGIDRTIEAWACE